MRNLLTEPRIVIPFLAAAVAVLYAEPTLPEAAGRQWWAYVQALANDQMQGRLTGTEDYQHAAQYVVEQLKASGVQPKGTDGFFQPVKFDVQRVNAAQSGVTLIENGAEHQVSLGEDALLSSRLPQPKTIEAPLVFVGYGLHIPDAHYDDLAGQDLHGTIIVYVTGGPSNLSSALKAHSRSSQEFLKAVEQAGAIGIVSIPNPKSMDVPWSRMSLAASQPGMRIADPALQDTHGPIFSMTLNPSHADQMFAGSGHSVAELFALGDAGKPLPRFPLHAQLRAHVTTTTEQVQSPNIIGVLPGSDPTLKNQYVVLTAHLDHLGVGEPINGDRIYNGAMDDASGVATLLDIARQLHESRAPVRRSILFVIVCAEEKGLLGSRYFARYPTVPAKSIVADLNNDMYLPIVPLHYLTVYGLEESTLGDEIRAAAARMDVKVLPDAQPDRNIFIRSDQYNFIRDGVPAIMCAFAPDPASPDQARTLKTWLTQRYHAPSDDLKQPVDLAAAARYNRILLLLTEEVANTDARPAWKPTSFFKRYAD